MEKKIIKPQMSLEDAHMRLCGIMVASIMPLNDVCDTFLTQAIHHTKWFVPTAELPIDYDAMTDNDKVEWKKKHLAKHTWYRHGIKKWCKAARTAMDANLSAASNRRATKVMNELEYEFHDQYEEQLKPYTDALYWAIRNTMTKAGYSADKGDLLAKVMQATTMLGATCGMYEESIRIFRKLSGSDFTPSFSSIYPLGAYKASRQLATLVAGKMLEDGKPIDLSHDKDVLTADRAIYAQVRRKELVDKAEQKALMEYAQRAEDVPDYWRERMKELEVKLNS